METCRPSRGCLAALLFLSAITPLALDPPGVFAQQKRHPSPAGPGTVESAVELIDGTPRPATAVTTPDANVHSTSKRWEPSVPKGREVASLATIHDFPGMLSSLGGDDVRVATLPEYTINRRTWLGVTADGLLFAAIQRQLPPTEQIDVYRSIDGGDTWTLWSTFAPGLNSGVSDFMVADGDADRAFIAYRYWNAGLARAEIRVAYADAHAAIPTWAAVTAMSVAATNFNAPRFDTDAWGYSNYYVYLGANDSDGDIWFTRSLNLGASYAPAVKIADAPSGFHYQLVADGVVAGFGGYVHACYVRDGTLDNGMFYRRAAAFAGGAWDAQVTLDAVDNGISPLVQAFAASPIDGYVYWFSSPGAVGFSQCRYSTDSGGTWPPTNTVVTGFAGPPATGAVAFPAGELTVAGLLWGGTIGTGVGKFLIQRSPSTNPNLLAPYEEFSTYSSTAFGTCYSIVFDPSHFSRVAALWQATDETNTYFRFDAEWRRDPGYANTDIGFPIAISGGGQTPPAVAEVGGLDSEKEIVFGTRSGNVWVVNHDGVVAPGWPVDIGMLPFDAPVAVGDLVGNGDFTVVSGNSTGQVYAFDANGDMLPGWPYNMGTGQAVYVSIGTLGPPRRRYVVAVSATKMALLDFWGVNSAPAWPDAPAPHLRPAALGDIDNDGITEIVTLTGSELRVYDKYTAAPKYSRSFPGETFSDAPTLADITGDGKIEIAAPTHSGKMYLLSSDGSNYSPSWPVTVSPGVALTAVSFGHILGTFEPELVFAEATGDVHVLYLYGAEQAGFPDASGSEVTFMPPILSPVNVAVSNVNMGTKVGLNTGTGRSWRNIPAAGVPGWPRNLPGAVEESFASGDIDNDGRNEIVVLGVDFLSVYDVAINPENTGREHWPMYGYDAQRTGCLACADKASAVGDGPAVAGRASLDVHPNPFNPATTITYEITRSGPVTLAIYDVGGRLVETLIDREHRTANRYSMSYQADVTSGVYFLRLTTGGEAVAHKMVLLK